MENKPIISVLMANYNKANYIGTAIESILSQTFHDWELILVDDKSTDSSIGVISKYLADSRIRFLSNDKNNGYIRSLKKMFALANGKYLAIVDSDDALAEDALELVVGAYANNPAVGLVYTQCWYCEADLNPVHLGYSAAIPSEKSNLHMNTVVALRTYKKEAYLKTTGYDENIIFAEDLDLTLKLEEATKLFFLDKPLYYYRVLPKSQTHSYINTRINRLSAAQAKLNAYERRLGTNIPNLNKTEISEVLFWGIVNSFLVGRWQLLKIFSLKLFSINPLVFFQPSFYKLVFLKILKILKLKKTKPLLKI